MSVPLVETVSSNIIISGAEQFLSSGKCNIKEAQEKRLQLNLKGKKILRENTDTQLLPRITQLIQEIDALVDGVIGGGHFELKTKVLDFQTIDPPLKRNDRGKIIELKTILALRAWSKFVQEARENIFAIIDVLHFGFDQNIIDPIHIPWMIDFTVDEIRTGLEESGEQKYKQGILWDWTYLGELAKIQFQNRTSEVQERPQSSLTLITDSRGISDKQKNPVFKNGITLDGNITHQVTEQKKQVMKFIANMIKNPKNNGRACVEAATKGMRGRKVTMR